MPDPLSPETRITVLEVGFAGFKADVSEVKQEVSSLRKIANWVLAALVLPALNSGRQIILPPTPISVPPVAAELPQSQPNPAPMPPL